MGKRISNKIIIILLVIAIFIVISFVLRALPAMNIDFFTYHMHRDPDTWYNFRQIEAMVQHFPQYNWFDPMTAYPSGKEVDWGPLFPLFAGFFAVIFGATQRFDMMMVVSWIPVLFGLFMIPVMFFLGRLIDNWKTGLISAIFIAVISGNYFYESYFGVVDHHIFEVFFTTIFSLFYILAIVRSRRAEISVLHPNTIKILLLPSCIAGLALGLGILTSPTGILFFFIMGIFTILQYTWNMFHQRRTDFLLIINGIISFFVIIFLWINGVPSSAYSLTTYSLAQIHLVFFFLLGTVFLQVLSMILKAKVYLFVILVVGTIVSIMAVMLVIDVPIIQPLMESTGMLFNPGSEWGTISELKPLSWGEIWVSFNIGFILSIIGLIVIIYHFIRKENSEFLYISIWAFTVLVLTTQQIRWEYYSAVIISLLSAYALVYVLILDTYSAQSQIKEESRQFLKSGTIKKERIPGNAADRLGVLTRRKGTVIVIICLGIFCGISILYDYSIVQNTGDALLISPQWVDALEWIQTGTPDLNMSYYGPYHEEGWQYPRNTYSVLSWWDSGHWITYIAKRIPVTNPFQDNIKSSAQFFLTESENKANKVADSYGVKYIITDSQMTFGKFPGMVQWYDQSLQNGYYTNSYYYNDEISPENTGLIGLINQEYYSTMVVRLQNLDGSLAVPDKVVFAVVSEGRDNTSLPFVNTIEFTDYLSGLEKLKAFNAKPHEGQIAVVKGFLLNSPPEKVDALRHYRLVYESADILPDGTYDSSTLVKVFEYVPGARFPGEGVIEVKIRTNIGRTFVYRQEAQNGYFILPYPTEDSSYPVGAVGPYHEVNSGKTIEVNEDDVQSGKNISS
jgi:oligosaccharyl transferase (archaeosortase A-associated)